MSVGGPETQHGELFPPPKDTFCLAEKSEFITEVSFREFGFFLPKKCPSVEKSLSKNNLDCQLGHPTPLGVAKQNRVSLVRRRSRHPLSEKARDGGHPGGTANF